MFSSVNGKRNLLVKENVYSSPVLQNEYSEQWALACGEILRILTHYNRPIYKVERKQSSEDCSGSMNHATCSKASGAKPSHSSSVQSEKRPSRPLSPWITDILLAAPLGIKSDYFRWYVIKLIPFLSHRIYVQSREFVLSMWMPIFDACRH